MDQFTVSLRDTVAILSESDKSSLSAHMLGDAPNVRDSAAGRKSHYCTMLGRE